MKKNGDSKSINDEMNRIYVTGWGTVVSLFGMWGVIALTEMNEPAAKMDGRVSSAAAPSETVDCATKPSP